MISPHTKPGTLVALVSLGERCVGHMTGQPISPTTKLKPGAIYTLRKIVKNKHTVTGYAAELDYDGDALVGLHLLNYLELPKSITDCLTGQPLLVDEMTGAATGDTAAPVEASRGLAGYLDFTASRRCFSGARGTFILVSDCVAFGLRSSQTLGPTAAPSGAAFSGT